MARVPFPLLLLLAVAGRAPVAAQIFVDDSATGANDGTSWANAFTDLQSALAASNGTGSIWVAAGTYRPSATGTRTDTFLVTTSLYGGFAGTETALDQRAGLFEETILSGDLLGDDGPGFANTSDNSFHVVMLNVFAFRPLDGFTITGGNAENGAGGGVVFGFRVQTTVENCIFRANQADGNGGGVWTSLGDGSVFRRCLFVGNRAGRRGGGIFSETMDTYIRFENCRFLGNSAAGGGGGFAGNLFGFFVGCEFTGNSADGPASLGGGAVMADYPSFLNSTVHANTAIGSPIGGGGIVTKWAGPIQNSILWGNSDDAGQGEGSQILYLFPGPLSVVVTNCIQGWTGQLDGGLGNVFSDPLFVDADGADGVSGTLDDDLRLRFGSPCVDTGSPYFYPPFLPEEDLDGNPRFTDSLACDGSGVIDMGAHERRAIDGTTSYCPQPPTSPGLPAEISAPCVVSVAGGDVHFRVGPVASSSGLLFFGSQKASAPFGADTLCIGGSFHRLAAMESIGSALVLDVALADPRAARLVPGSTWHFQALFRDAGTLRLSDATTITFRD